VAAEAVLAALAVATALAPVPVAVVAAATPVLAPATEAVPIPTAPVPPRRVTARRERLDRGAEITWIQDGTHHVHTTHRPEHFVKELDLDAITGLTITRPTLEETYLSLVSSKEPQS